MAVAVCAALVCACGGGGGGSPSQPPASTLPTSGAYTWLLKAEGPTGSLRYGLSLVHPQAPGIEFVIEPPSAAVTEARVVSTGSIDATGLKVTGLQPRELIYIVGGDVRRVPLQADGTPPKSRVGRAATTSACGILIDAIDHAVPERSRFVISTAGADGRCTTADDGRAEVRLDATSGIVLTPLTTDLPLAALRDPVTLAPRGWISARRAVFWSPSSSPTVELRAAGAPPIDRVVASTYRTALIESPAGLALLDFPGGDTFTETTLGGVPATGWQLVGFDAAAYYLYRNSGSGSSASWQTMRVGRQFPHTTSLASGSGEIALASMGTAILYLTVIDATDNRLLAVDKTVVSSVRALESLGKSGFATVSTSGAGAHQLWRVMGVGSSSPAYAVEMIDESFNRLHVSASGGFPLAQLDASRVDFANSETRSRFVFATGYGARAFADARLSGYDADTRALTDLGALGGGSSGIVFASVAGSSSTSIAGFAAPSVNGEILGSGARVFTFDFGVAGSLKFTTSQQ